MKKKILIIEDDEMLLDMYRQKFRMEGFSVISAKNGQTAIYKAKQIPDLILLDILMPKMNGFEVLKRIKEDSQTCKIPVIVLTNIGSESVDNDKNLALSLGARDYLVKALNTPEEVVRRVVSVLK